MTDIVPEWRVDLSIGQLNRFFKVAATPVDDGPLVITLATGPTNESYPWTALTASDSRSLAGALATAADYVEDRNEEDET